MKNHDPRVIKKLSKCNSQRNRRSAYRLADCDRNKIDIDGTQPYNRSDKLHSVNMEHYDKEVHDQLHKIPVRHYNRISNTK